MAQSIVKLVDESSNAAVTGVDFFNEMRLAMSRQISTVTESAARQEVRETDCFHNADHCVRLHLFFADHSLYVSMFVHSTCVLFTHAHTHTHTHQEMDQLRAQSITAQQSKVEIELALLNEKRQLLSELHQLKVLCPTHAAVTLCSKLYPSVMFVVSDYR